MTASTRRGFMQNAAGGLAGLAALTQRPRSAMAIEPIVRDAPPGFKLSLAAYSYRDLLKAKPPKLTLADFIADCAKFGLDGTELTSYYFPDDPTPDYLRQLKNQAFRLGLDVSGTAVGNDFCTPPGPDRDKQLAHVKRWVEHAAILGAPVIRIFSGKARSGQSEVEARKLVVAGIEECCDFAGKHGVFLALENHGGLTTTPDGILELVRAVQSPWFGVNLDTGNFATDDVYGDLARLAPYAINVQVKVSIRPQGGPKQPADFSRLAGLLREAGYRGYVVLEYEEPAEPRGACPQHLAKLREAFS